MSKQVSIQYPIKKLGKPEIQLFIKMDGNRA